MLDHYFGNYCTDTISNTVWPVLASAYALQTQDNVDTLEDALENLKGADNFKNLLLYTSGGKEKGANVIPLAEVAAKDGFYNIKIASRDE